VHLDTSPATVGTVRFAVELQLSLEMHPALVQAGMTVSFQYNGGSEPGALRRVKVKDTGSGLISGNDMDKQQFRKFDMTKIDNLRLEETPEHGLLSGDRKCHTCNNNVWSSNDVCSLCLTFLWESRRCFGNGKQMLQGDWACRGEGCNTIVFACHHKCPKCQYIHPYKAGRQHATPLVLDSQRTHTSTNVIASTPERAMKKRWERSGTPPRMTIVKDPDSQGITATLKNNYILVLSNFFCEESDLLIYNQLQAQLDWQPHHRSLHLTASTQNALCASILAKINVKFAVNPRSAAVNFYNAGQHTKNPHMDSHATDQTHGIVAIICSF